MTRYWLSFDLGLQGDYNSLYSWLDKQGAQECGDSVATFKSKKTREQIAIELKDIFEEKSKPRLYLISMQRGGKFLSGKRKRAPWTGYADVSVGSGEDV